MVTIIFMVTFQYSNIHDPTFQPQLKHKMHHILETNTHNTHHLNSPPPRLFSLQNYRPKCEHHIMHSNTTIQITILQFNFLSPVSHQPLKLLLSIHKGANNCHNISLGHLKCTKTSIMFNLYCDLQTNLFS